MASLFTPFLQLEDSAGAPRSGAKLYFYASGTTTPITVYTDSGLGTPLSNPVVADASGIFAAIWIAASSYKFKLTTSADVEILTVDNIAGSAAFSDSLFTLQDGADTTKQLNFQLSPITTGTTRTWTVQDVSGTVYVSGGQDVAIADGGTNASTALGGLINLGFPVGTVLDYGGTSAPSGFLLCYGQAVSRTTYALLFAAISTTYGVGDGSTTFNLPDVRGRVVAGKDNMGGSSADRLTNQTGGLNGDTLGATGGSETHTLTTAQMPAHTHTIGMSGSSGATSPAAPGAGAPTTYNSGSAGGDGAHNNVQPTIIFNKIIFAGV